MKHSTQRGYSSNCLLREHMRDELDENQISLYARLKDIKDSRKLAARYPAYLKSELAKVPARFTFTPGLPPKFPAWVVCRKNALSFHHAG